MVSNKAVTLGNNAKCNKNSLYGKGDIMTKANTVKATKAINVMVQVPANFTAINSPKMNSVAIACNTIKAIALTGTALKPNLTALGHIATCKGGIIDSVILSGNVHTIESFIDTLINSGINNVKSDIKQYGLTDTLRAVMAKRITDHVNWCSNTLNNSHGGFADRLKNVSLESKRAEIAVCMIELARLLHNQYRSRYASLYVLRNSNK